jgi:hypothetical protein
MLFRGAILCFPANRSAVLPDTHYEGRLWTCSKVVSNGGLCKPWQEQD